MADVKDILGVPRNATTADKPEAVKPKKEKMQRPAGMSREAFALLGDSHPIMSTQLMAVAKKKDTKVKPKASTKGTVTWAYKPFENSARTDGLKMCHWSKAHKDAQGRIKEPDDLDYYFAKFNKKVQLYKYNDEEYDILIKPTSGDWSKAETNYLLDLCERLDLRFVVIADRYEFPGGPPRSLEDLKERYYGVARRLLMAREGGEAPVANNVLVKYPYNKAQEVERKRAIDMMLSRTPQQLAEENAILAEAKAIEDRRKAEAAAAAAAAAQAAAAAAAARRAAPPAPAPQPAAAAPPPAMAAAGPGAGPMPGMPPGAMPGVPPGGPAAAAAAAGMPGAPGAPGMPGMPHGGMPPGAMHPGMGPGGMPGMPGMPGAPMPGHMGMYSRYPDVYPNNPGPGVPSLFNMNLEPAKPKPGAYARCVSGVSLANSMMAGLQGGRMQKAVEQTLADLGWAPALVGPRVGTRCVVGGWLALRAEIIALHEARRARNPGAYAAEEKKQQKRKR